MRVDVIATKKIPSKVGSRSSQARCHAACGDAVAEAIMFAVRSKSESECGEHVCLRQSTMTRASAESSSNEEAGMTDHERLSELNQAYIRASLASDTTWYDEYLADDFVCINPDATLLDKPQFLRMIGGGSDQATYNLDVVHIRVFGDVALIRAIGSWRTHAGVSGSSHYTDVYVRRGEDWKVVSAQITRPPAPAKPA
jgi:ketosteroid isomerase-like protein